MAAFPTMTLTNAGQALQTKVQAGATLAFTRIALGDGQLNGQPISPLTALISQKASVEVDTVRVVDSSTAQASGFFSNADITTGFWWRETGLFAQDPDVGEILYGYTNAGDAGDYVPTVEDTRIEKYIFCSIGVANATEVDITLPQSDTFIPMTQKGQAGGVASLGNDGKVPEGQLPEMDYVPNSQKGIANGVATLDGNGKLTASQKATYTASEVGADPAGTAANAVNTHNSSGTAHQSLFAAKQNKLTGTQGQVVGFDSSGNAIAQEAPSGLPEGGTQGQLLAKGASSAEWVDNPTRAFGPQTVATSAWASDSTYPDYPYRASIALSGVTANHAPIVNFSNADSLSGKLSPVADSYAGGVYIYATEALTETVNIGSVICVKVVGT